MPACRKAGVTLVNRSHVSDLPERNATPAEFGYKRTNIWQSTAFFGVAGSGALIVAFDGKVLKGSFDNFNDIKARQVLSAFAVDPALVHVEIDEKSNEIPAVQRLLEELDVAGHVVTCDAMHCQKKPHPELDEGSKPPLPRTPI
jgi:hypothetical protein